MQNQNVDIEKMTDEELLDNFSYASDGEYGDRCEYKEIDLRQEILRRMKGEKNV